jgi:membrane dipeptidase
MRATMRSFHLTIAVVLFVSETIVAQVSPKARAIHDSAIVVDTHADTPVRFLDGGFDVASTDPKDHGHISLDKARVGNLAAVFFSIWVAPRFDQGQFAR